MGMRSFVFCWLLLPWFNSLRRETFHCWSIFNPQGLIWELQCNFHTTGFILSSVFYVTLLFNRFDEWNRI